MYNSASFRPLTVEELQYRRLVLRDAIICIGWIKFMSIFCYTGLYVMIKMYSEGTWSSAIQYLMLIIVPIQILTAVLLFLGAMEVKPFALKAALWLSLFMTVYITIVSVIATIYFIRLGTEAIHFIIATIFAILSFSVCSVFCHDIIVIYTFIKIVKCPCALDPGYPIISLPADGQKGDNTSASSAWTC